MDQVLITLGTQDVTLGMVLLGVCVLALVLLLALYARLSRLGGARLDETRAQIERQARTERQVEQMLRSQVEIFGRLQGVGEVLSNKQSELARTVSERLDAVGQRVGENLVTGAQATNEQLQKLEARLAVIDAAQQNIGSLSEQVTGLKAILANRPARGAFGQGQMEAIIKDALPSSGYTFQGMLSTRVRPDCLIHLPGDSRPLVIDAKFPLEAFEELRRCESPEAEARASARLRSDIIGHVQDVRKYLIANETQEVALLFIPSEALYAELHERFEDIVHRAHKARVLIVSPSLLMLAIQVVQGLMRDAAMREQAHLIQKEVGHLLDDVRRLTDRVGKLKSHMGSTMKDLDDIEISANKIAGRGQRIDQMDFDEKPALAGPDKLPNPLRAAE
ncbi:DNA recombination protein RmuC [Terrihabitans sp. B22-R8]|uniref:DNA recombination protein RmuC n=1 Tax=Terrihabitans sp. B22-R8 TaxID=3425128 RepID=UPI00403CB6EF